MGFIQVIEYQTTRREEIEALYRQWEADDSTGLEVRVVDCADRDRPGVYMTIVEFPSYEAAMENSNRPETTAFAEQMAKLCDGPATFRNLDVVYEPGS